MCLYGVDSLRRAPCLQVILVWCEINYSTIQTYHSVYIRIYIWHVESSIQCQLCITQMVDYVGDPSFSKEHLVLRYQCCRWSLTAKVFLESIIPLDRALAEINGIVDEADETGILNLECQLQNISRYPYVNYHILWILNYPLAV